MPSKKNTIDNEETTGTLKKSLGEGEPCPCPTSNPAGARGSPISRQEGEEKQRREAEDHIFPEAGSKPALGLG